MNALIARIYLIFILNLVFVSTLFGQTSEEDLFRERAEDEPIPNIALGLGLTFANDTKYFSPLYSSIDDQFFEVAPTIKGYLPLTKRVSLHLHIPYLIKFGLIEVPGNLPGLNEFQIETGLGDFSGGISFFADTITPLPIVFLVQVDGIIPMGTSRFDESYEGYLALGNGFWTLSSGIGLKIGISSGLTLYSNFGYISRLSRTFDTSSSFFSNQSLDPDAVKVVNAGISFIGIKDLAINFEYERDLIGAIERKQDMFNSIVEPEFQVTKVGLKLLSTKSNKFVPTIFIGMERTKDISTDKDHTSFVASVHYVSLFNIFGFNF